MGLSKIEIANIRTDGGTQSRNEVNQDIVDDYARAMAQPSADFPAIRVIYDGTDYWLADGFHRLAAAKQLGNISVLANVDQGTRRDAVLFSVGANATHGLRRTRDDVRRAIKTLLQDEEWGKWSDSEISRRVGCDHKTVGAVRRDLQASGEIPTTDTRIVERNGVQYEMKAAPKPLEHKRIRTHVGREFELGETLWFQPRGISMAEYLARRLGRLTRITDDEVTFESVVDMPFTTLEASRTVRIADVDLTPVTDTHYVYWYLRAYHQDVITLFPFRDHFIAFEAPSQYRAYETAIQWRQDADDHGVAYRFHESYLKYWKKERIAFKVMPIETLPYRMHHLVVRAGRAHTGGINVPLTPPPAPDAQPSEHPVITNGVGTTFRLGECVRLTMTREPNRLGYITQIEGEYAIVDSVICRPRAGTPVNGLRVSRMHLFSASDNEFLYWYATIRLGENKLALFPYEDHFICFNSYRTDFSKALLAGFNWHPNEKWDSGVAWRLDKSYLDYCETNGVAVAIAAYNDGTDQLEGRLKRLVYRAGAARGGEMNRPPQPEAAAIQSPSPLPDPVPEWAKTGQVKHASGKICEVQGVYWSDNRWMLRVEIIKPEEGFANAPLSEFEPYTEPTATPERTETTAFQVGDKVITRTGREGEVIESNGLVRVKTASYITNHEPKTLKPVLRAAPAPTSTSTPIVLPSQPEPLMTLEEMRSLEHSLSAMFDFMETRLLPDRGTLLEHLKQIRLAALKAEMTFYEMYPTKEKAVNATAYQSGGVAS